MKCHCMAFLKPLVTGFAFSIIACNSFATDSSNYLRTDPPSGDQLWGLRMIGLNSAVKAGFTGKGIIVGVPDDIIFVNHPEFAGKVVGTYNIYPDSPYEPNTGESHGTHIAGTILGTNVGIATGSKLVGINFTSGGWTIPDFNEHIIAGYDFGIRNGVKVYNNSWGVGNFADYTFAKIESELPNVVQAFRNTTAAGSIQVFAAANEGRPTPAIQAALPYYYPEFKPYWIAVVAVGPDGNLSSYSNAANIAAEWTIAAPGGARIPNSPDQDIWSTWLSDSYAAGSGTSMAAPHVTGTVAVAMEIFPHATGPELVQMVLQTATDIGAPGVDATYGWGLLNLGNIVQTIEPRTAGLFANAAWSRFVTMDHMGTALRQRIFTSSLGSGVGSQQEVLSFSTGDGKGSATLKTHSLWVLPIYGIANLDSGADSQSLHTTTTGTWIGTDLIDLETTRLGVAAGVSRTDMETITSLDKGRTDALHFGLFASKNLVDWVLEGSGQFALMNQSLTRYDISGAAGTARPPVGKSSFRSDALEAAVSLARKFQHNSGWSLAPYASLNWRWQQSDAFSETDARIFNLKAPQNTLYQLEPGAGLRWSSAPTMSRAGSLRFSADVGYSQLTGDLDNKIQVTLLGRPIGAHTATLGMDILNFGAQLNFATLSRNASGILGYRGRLQQNANEHTFMAGVNVKF